MTIYTSWKQLLKAKDKKLSLNYRVCTDKKPWHNPVTPFDSFENALFGNPSRRNNSAKELFRRGSELQRNRELKYGKAHFVVIWSDIFTWALVIENSINIVNYVATSEISILESECKLKDSSPLSYKTKLKFLCESVIAPEPLLFEKNSFSGTLPVEIKSTSNSDNNMDSSKEESTFFNDIDNLFDDDSLDQTEREKIVMSRIGQGEFKDNVKSFWGSEKCAVTGCDIPAMLIASHIKPWSECESKQERLDGANGLLLCAHIDKLFDNYLVTFIKESEGNYKLILNDDFLKTANIESLDKLGIYIDKAKIHCDTYQLNLSEGRRFDMYMKYHNGKFNEKNIK
ncbi:hypothetical protein CXF85_11305 [Colwellia sp. 75C3]|uniref:HNH endonuclease n=1 Tax=Colwellia sp. 75C3 TaxID=888425 RepID=UPI000C346F2F|nr:HNH endonuclease [Colwellia sp. 75C3]PKG83308.1 hypothetical protein CXF85_11305 [Colwellia sp. 75C3]